MSLLVQYTLTSADHYAHQQAAMTALVNDLKSENLPGTGGMHYSCFATDDPTRFIGLFEFDTDAGKQAFLQSAAFATYRETVGPTFANPPETTEITAIASTRA